MSTNLGDSLTPYSPTNSLLSPLLRLLYYGHCTVHVPVSLDVASHLLLREPPHTPHPPVRTLFVEAPTCIHMSWRVTMVGWWGGGL